MLSTLVRGLHPVKKRTASVNFGLQNVWLFQNVLQWSYFTSIQYKIYGKSMLHNSHRQKFWLIHQLVTPQPQYILQVYHP